MHYNNIWVSLGDNIKEWKQDSGNQALIFKLNGRPEEGKILSVEEIKEIGYEFGLLTKNY